MAGLIGPERPDLGDVGRGVDRRLVLQRRRIAGRLVDVLVVVDDLGAPLGVVVEVMLPAQADDVAPVVALKPRQPGGRELIPLTDAVETVGGDSDRAAEL